MTQEELYQLYVVEGLSFRQVAAKFDVSDGTIRRLFKKFGIKSRTKSEALSGEKDPQFGKTKPDEVRKKTSETLLKTNSDHDDIVLEEISK
jgi:transposase